jgi:acylphosphatase
MVDERVRRRIEVYGRVQGVSFREGTKRHAERRGVTGWVRNRPDGSVEAVLEGAPSDVLSLVESCRVGPPWARVDRIDVHDEPPEGLTGFSVR